MGTGSVGARRTCCGSGGRSSFHSESHIPPGLIDEFRQIQSEMKPHRKKKYGSHGSPSSFFPLNARRKPIVSDADKERSGKTTPTKRRGPATSASEDSGSTIHSRRRSKSPPRKKAHVGEGPLRRSPPAKRSGARTAVADASKDVEEPPRTAEQETGGDLRKQRSGIRAALVWLSSLGHQFLKPNAVDTN